MRKQPNASTITDHQIKKDSARSECYVLCPFCLRVYGLSLCPFGSHSRDLQSFVPMRCGVFMDHPMV